MQRDLIFKVFKPHRLLKISALAILFSTFTLTSHTDSSFQSTSSCNAVIRR